MEGSFAHAANHHHFKRARWRRLWRQQIQDWLIAAVQNNARLCGPLGSGVTVPLPKRPKTGAAAGRGPARAALPRPSAGLSARRALCRFSGRDRAA